MIKQVVHLLAVIILFSSCSEPDNTSHLTALTKALENANQVYARNNEQLLFALDVKLRDRFGIYGSDFWMPKANKSHELTTDMLVEVDKLTKEFNRQATEYPQNANKIVHNLFITKGKAHDLFQQLFTYKQNLISLLNGNYTEDYPSLHEQLRIDSINYFKIIPAISVLNNSVESEKSWLDSTFKNADALMCQAVLHTITNKVLLSETLMLDYFDRRTSRFDCGNYDRFSAIITLNSTYIKSGDSIEGVAVYSFKPKVKPGKYTVPVRIEYYRPDGVKDTVSKNLSYTVVD